MWICLQHDLASEEAFEAAVSMTREAITAPGMEGRSVHYLEALPGVDRIAYDRLSDLIPEENFLGFVRLWHGEFPARAGQTWITTRLQIHLLAAACGAAGTALEVDEDYYRVNHASLTELGTGWSVTPAGSTSLSAPSVSQGFPYKARTVSQDKIHEAKKLYPATPKPAPVVAEPEPEPKRGWRTRR